MSEIKSMGAFWKSTISGEFRRLSCVEFDSDSFEVTMSLKPHGLWKSLFVYGGVAENGGFSVQIIPFNRDFHYKSSILGSPYFGNTHMIGTKFGADSRFFSLSGPCNWNLFIPWTSPSDAHKYGVLCDLLVQANYPLQPNEGAVAGQIWYGRCHRWSWKKRGYRILGGDPMQDASIELVT